MTLSVGTNTNEANTLKN